MSLVIRAITKALQEAGIPNARHYTVQDEYIGVFPIGRKIHNNLPFLLVIEHDPLDNVRPPLNTQASYSTGLVRRNPAILRLLNYSSIWTSQNDNATPTRQLLRAAGSISIIRYEIADPDLFQQLLITTIQALIPKTTKPIRHLQLIARIT